MCTHKLLAHVADTLMLRPLIQDLNLAQKLALITAPAAAI